jgi:hypothetical protein
MDASNKNAHARSFHAYTYKYMLTCNERTRQYKVSSQTYIYTCIHTHTCAWPNSTCAHGSQTQAYTHTHIHAYIHIRTRLFSSTTTAYLSYTYTCLCSHMQNAHMAVNTYACMHACMNTSTRTHTHTNTYAHAYM